MLLILLILFGHCYIVYYILFFSYIALHVSIYSYVSLWFNINLVSAKNLIYVVIVNWYT